MDTVSTMTIFNAVAEQFMQMNAPLRFAPAITPAEIHQVYQLRYDIVLEQGWLAASDLPDGIEKDEYDDYAVHLAAWEGDKLVAVTRLIFPCAERPLPTEAVFNIHIEPVGQVVDVSRTVIARAYRDARQHRLLRGMIGQVWLEVTRRGYIDFCAILADDMLQRYHSVGFEFYDIGDAKDYWGTVRRPYKFDLVTTANLLMARMNGASY